MFEEDDFIIVTGGKISESKYQTLQLMEAVKNLNKSNVKLLVFGSISNEIKEKFDCLCSENIIYLGWATVFESYQYFEVADLVIFPATHSVYWEQAAGMGKPLMVKYWDGITHVDLGSNVIFLKEDSEKEIRENLTYLLNHPEKFNYMKKCAESCMSNFSYIDIAKRCLK